MNFDIASILLRPCETVDLYQSQSSSFELVKIFLLRQSGKKLLIKNRQQKKNKKVLKTSLFKHSDAALSLRFNLN